MVIAMNRGRKPVWSAVHSFGQQVAPKWNSLEGFPNSNKMAFAIQNHWFSYRKTRGITVPKLNIFKLHFFSQKGLSEYFQVLCVSCLFFYSPRHILIGVYWTLGKTLYIASGLHCTYFCLGVLFSIFLTYYHLGEKTNPCHYNEACQASTSFLLRTTYNWFS